MQDWFNEQKNKLILPLTVFVGITLLSIAFAFTNISWDEWKRASCLPERCFCEALRPRETILQPANAYSNLGFVLVGLLVLATAPAGKALRHKDGNPIRSERAYPLIYGFSMLGIGLGSWFYHASFTDIGGFMDILSMFLFGSFIMIYNYSRWRLLTGASFAAAYIGVNVILGGLNRMGVGHGREIFAGLIVMGIVFEVVVRREKRTVIKTGYFLGSLGSFSLAFYIWLQDLNGTWCMPESLLQGHAVWHLLGALSAWLLFLYYRSELISSE